MRLKYYLRGAGIAMILTAAALMIGNRAIPKEERVSSTEVSTETEREPSIAEALEKNSTEKATEKTTETPSSEKQAETETVSSEKTTEETGITQTTEVDEDGRTVVTVHERSTEEPETETEESTTQESSEPERETETQAETETEKPVQKGPVEIRIDRGDGPTIVANRLEAAGVISDATSYVEYLISHGENDHLETGSFSVPPGADFKTITEILTTNEYERRNN